MNVSTLRTELEALERAGYGHCRVSVYPALSEDERLGNYVLDLPGWSTRPVSWTCRRRQLTAW